MALATISTLRQQSQCSTFYFLVDIEDVTMERHEARSKRADLDGTLKCRIPSGSLVPVHARRREYLSVIRLSLGGNERDTSDPVKASNQRGGIGTHRHRRCPGMGKPSRLEMCSCLQCIRLQRNTWPSTPLYRMYICTDVHVQMYSTRQYENC